LHELTSCREAEVEKFKRFIDVVKMPFLVMGSSNDGDAKYFVDILENLRKQSVDIPTIIGVV